MTQKSSTIDSKPRAQTAYLWRRNLRKFLIYCRSKSQIESAAPGNNIQGLIQQNNQKHSLV